MPSLRAATYYVSPTGTNSPTGGSMASPWQTISYAVSRVSAGDTVLVGVGVYNELVNMSQSGTAGSRITFKNVPGEIPVIDGTGKSVGSETAVVTFNGTDYVSFDGFEVRNLTGTTNSKTPIGILVKNAAVGIEIANCHIHDIQSTSNDGNAHGILVSGRSTTAISDLKIRDCLIENLVLGNSEALVLNGNVDGFEATGNTVRNCNNIGIDFIGFEGVGPSGSDQARNGICADNTVHGCSTVGNPAYDGWSCAGIYVDGGRDIIIERNRVYSNDIGIELASEHAGRATSNITVRDNLVWRNDYGGIFTGGYKSTVGSTENCTITGNSLYQNDIEGDGNGELLIRFKSYGLDVKNNIFVAGAQNLVVSNIATSTSGLVFDYNLYYSPYGTGEWTWGNDDWFDGFNMWKSKSGSDSHSAFANPSFANTSGAVGSFDFRITDTSPAYESGDPDFVATVGQTDAYGNPRVSGACVDVGAHEVTAAPLTESEAWRLLHFGTTENAGDAADGADPDCDGLANILEFAFGSDPNVGTTVGHPSIIAANSIAIDRNSAANLEVTYYFFSSDTLAENSWEQIATRPPGGPWSSITGVTVSDNGSSARVTDNRAAPNRRFYRPGTSR